MEIDIIRETRRVYSHTREARQSGLPCTLTIDEWLAIIERFSGLCAYCECTPFETLDHLIPRQSRGGTIAENCIPACLVCNSRKNHRLTSGLGDNISAEERLSQVRYALQNNPSLLKGDAKRTRYMGYHEAKTICPTEQDKEAVAEIRRYYGLSSDNEAIRFALNKLLREIQQEPLARKEN